MENMSLDWRVWDLLCFQVMYLQVNSKQKYSVYSGSKALTPFYNFYKHITDSKKGLTNLARWIAKCTWQVAYGKAYFPVAISDNMKLCPTIDIVHAGSSMKVEQPSSHWGNIMRLWLDSMGFWWPQPCNSDHRKRVLRRSDTVDKLHI